MRKFRKLLSVLLCAVLLLPCAALLSRAAEEKPVYIMVRGSTTIYKYNDDGTKTAMYDDGDYISQVVKEAMPLLPAARASGDFTEYSEKVLEIMRPAFKDFQPSAEDGSVPANTHMEYGVWSRESLENAGTTYYEYWTDERLSPFAQARDFNEFLKTVTEITGKDKFLFNARCLGPVVLLTWLCEYQRPVNYKNVAGVELSFSTHNGMGITDAAYTGTCTVPQEALQTWLTDSAHGAVADSDYARAAGIVRTLVDAVGGSLGIRLTVKELNRLYAQLKDCLFRPLILEYYGRCLCYMACVNSRFDEMMRYLYPTKEEQNTYIYAISELMRYHNNVYPVINTMLQEILDQGKTMLIFADYGGQQYPVCEESLYLGDYQVGTASMSLGATTAEIGSTLPQDYVTAQQRKGLGKYISPDRKVDASTCAFPDNTFFISNLDHHWPAEFANKEEEIGRIRGFNVNSDPSLPQFLYYDEAAEKLVPLSSVIAPETQETPAEEEETPTGVRGIFARIRAFFKRIAASVRSLFRLNLR